MTKSSRTAGRLMLAALALVLMASVVLVAAPADADEVLPACDACSYDPVRPR